MAKITFYPLGNADSYLIQTDKGKNILFDFAEMRDATQPDDKRIPLEKSLKEDIDWHQQNTSIDVLAISHGDNDHVKGISNTFWLNHAEKYQGKDRIKVKDLWVPAALIVEEGSEDDTRIIRQEARYRFLEKQGIKVFARPEHLKDWLASKGKKLDDYRHLICDAGNNVPGWNMTTQGIEFFVHAPFAERAEDGILDRNTNCLVMQISIMSGEIITKLLATGDSVSEQWSKIVNITKYHKNDAKLAWDIFKIPHHCSYKAMSEEKGDSITTPTDEFEWLLKQGSERGIMVSTSNIIPDRTSTQPPHVEAYRRYKETADKFDAELVVTMEHPDRHNPRRLVINIDGSGAKVKKPISSPSVTTTTQRAPRVG
jgi:beta-lactamase superfamily II metal-dependent hydrolase